MRKNVQTDPRITKKGVSTVVSGPAVLQHTPSSMVTSLNSSYGYLLPTSLPKPQPVLPSAPYLSALLKGTKSSAQIIAASKPALSRGTVVAQSLPKSIQENSVAVYVSNGPIPKKTLNPIISNTSAKAVLLDNANSSIASSSSSKSSLSGSEQLKEFMKKSFLLCQSEEERSAVRSYLTSLIRDMTRGDTSKITAIEWANVPLPDPKRLMSTVPRLSQPVVAVVQPTPPVAQRHTEHSKHVNSDYSSREGGDRKRMKRFDEAATSDRLPARVEPMFVVDSTPTPFKVLQEHQRPVLRPEMEVASRNSKYSSKKQPKSLHHHQLQSSSSSSFADSETYDNDSAAIVGTCLTTLKDYSRLHGAASASTVRPEAVLFRSLDNILQKWRLYRDRVNRERKLEQENDDDDTKSSISEDSEAANSRSVEEFRKWRKKVKSTIAVDFQEARSDNAIDYPYIWSQFKSIRQDLMVQRIQNAFAVNVYESHARVCLIEGDLDEFNQCQTQLMRLYKLNIGGSIDEFNAYYVLYFIFQQNTANFNGNTIELHSIMKKCLSDRRGFPCTVHALETRRALSEGNYHKFFSLYSLTSNLGKHILDVFIDSCRVDAIRKMLTSYKPDISTDFVMSELSFQSLAICVPFLESIGMQFSNSDCTAIDVKNSRIDLSSFET